MLLSLDEAPIKVDEIPDHAFDSVAERERVAALFAQYNHPPQPPQPQLEAENQAGSQNPHQSSEDQASQDSSVDQPDNNSAGEGEEGDEQEESAGSDEGDENGGEDEPEQASGEEDQPGGITPEIDAGFAQIARERVARAPFRYYIRLPLARGAALWFDTHSQYYPF